MREIKFRAWDKVDGRMLYREVFDRNWYATPANDDIRAISFGDRFRLELMDVIAMDFTGLKDKNGKDIYEGDVLIYIGTNISSMVVKFDNGCFVGEGPFNTLPLKSYLGATDFESIEIIGNIYENPELLK